VSAAKAKGTRWETALVLFFQALGFLTVRRNPPQGIKDSGDLAGMEPFVGQAKDWTSWQDAIREGLDGAEKQKLVAKLPYGVAFVKRARRSTGQGYAVMTIDTFAAILRELRSHNQEHQAQ
jgi:hypothetical protein